MRQYLLFEFMEYMLIWLCGMHLVSAQMPPDSTAEKTLTSMLLSRYKEFGVIGRPVRDSKVKMVIQYGLQLIQILHLDENKQVLRSNCWTVYRWVDPLLKWNASQYDDLKVVRMFPKQIWTPDIKLYNFADERLQEYREGGLLVHNDGSILWLQQALFKSTCQVETTYFPFDSQVCMLEFGSLTYDKTQLELEWWTPDNSDQPMPYVDFSDYVPANDWYADGEAERYLRHEERTKQIRSVKRYRVRGHMVDGVTQERHYPVLRFLIRLYRNPSFYMFILVVPCLLLSLLTLIVFWLPPDSPAKMMLGINIFVAFFVLLLLLAESMPTAVKNFPLIGVFFCLNMVMITLSTYLATVVVNLFYRGEAGRPLPIWVRRFIVDGCGRMVRLRQDIPLAEIKRPGNLEAANHIKNPSRVVRVNGYDRCSRNEGDESCPDMHVRRRKWSSAEFRRSQQAEGLTGSKMQSGPTNDEDSRGLSEILLEKAQPMKEDVHEVNEDILYLNQRETKGDEREAIAMEWRTLALVVDRIFFILYLIIMAVALIMVVLMTEVVDMTLLLINRNAISLSND